MECLFGVGVDFMESGFECTHFHSGNGNVCFIIVLYFMCNTRRNLLKHIKIKLCYGRPKLPLKTKKTATKFTSRKLHLESINIEFLGTIVRLFV